MRDELMIEAICWDLGRKVTAEYAHHRKDFFYFCPHDQCVREVHAGRKKNFYFVANEKHVSGCPNEPQERESPNSVPGLPVKKQSIVPTNPVPTILGPNVFPNKKLRKPTLDELRKLAGELKNEKPYCAGTLREVVLAWTTLPRNERNLEPLHISGEDQTYRSAFHFLGEPSDQIQDVPWGIKIVFGAATVSKSNNNFFVTTRKTFPHDGKRLNVVFRIRIDDVFEDHHSWLINRTCTVFYFGSMPNLSSTGKSFSVTDNWNDEYKGIIILAGEHVP